MVGQEEAIGRVRGDWRYIPCKGNYAQQALPHNARARMGYGV